MKSIWAVSKKYYARILLIALIIYLVFVVNLGTGTVAEHLYRIGATPEGRQLGSELGDTVVSTAHALVDRVSRLLHLIFE